LNAVPVRPSAKATLRPWKAEKPDAALLAGALLLEGALAAAAGVDLRLDHPERAVQRAGGGLRLLRPGHRAAVGHRGAELLEELLGLVLVDVHVARNLPRSLGGQPARSPTGAAAGAAR
jgi:hypothetical protein